MQWIADEKGQAEFRGACAALLRFFIIWSQFDIWRKHFPEDFVGQNWGQKKWILHDFCETHHVRPRNRKLASCNMDEQSKYDLEETENTSDVELSLIHI